MASARVRLVTPYSKQTWCQASVAWYTKTTHRGKYPTNFIPPQRWKTLRFFPYPYTSQTTFGIVWAVKEFIACSRGGPCILHLYQAGFQLQVQRSLANNLWRTPCYIHYTPGQRTCNVPDTRDKPFVGISSVILATKLVEDFTHQVRQQEEREPA